MTFYPTLEDIVAGMAIILIWICVLEDKEPDLDQPQGRDLPEPDPCPDP